MIQHLKDVPTWTVLLFLFILVMVGYYIRPDNLTEDAAKGILGALLLSLQTKPRNETQPPQ